jgi:uncharacterized pyridoxal phosphate-containing UPF0001 family protein
VESRAFSALSAETVRSNLERIRSEVGQNVTIVAATKYVEVEQLGVLAEAGIEVVGENRAQDLEAKHARHGDAFRWHFIGHLQSRKAKTVNAVCELCHSLASESAASRLTIPALVEVNLSGEESKSGVPESALEDFLALYDDVRGLMTMPPETGDPRPPAGTSAVCASSRNDTVCRSFPWGRARTTAWRPTRARRWCA